VIKIEVTGNSIPEVADKLLAIGGNLKGTAIIEGARAAVNAMKAMGVAEQAPADPTPSEVASSGATEASPTATSGSEPTPTTSEPEAPAAPEVDPIYLRDLVLKVVEKRDKLIVMDILERFGIAKASQVDPERAPELVATLLEALGK
jgi:hypothetical protein